MKQSSYRQRDYEFGQAMLSLRSTVGLTQAGLADFLHISRKAVGDWETGVSYPKVTHFKQLMALAIQSRAFPAGQEAEQIRSLWRAAHIKMLFDEPWLAALLAPLSPPAMTIHSGDASPGSERQNRAYGLPFQPTAFIGRTEEITQIKNILQERVCRLLTLLGPGGIGKTRLGMELVAGQSSAFADGAAFVALASISTTNQIISAIADTLNLSFVGQADSRNALLHYLKNRNLLLVLDNFEHLMESVDLVRDILERTRGVTMIVTSRVRLHLQAEWLFDIEGLSYPVAENRASTTPQAVMSYSAIQLFVQRARQVQPRFALNDLSTATAIKICRHVAGMPLAIELAAASVRILTLADIERQIRSNLDPLTTTLHDVPERHRSLRAVFDHSWNLLSDPEQRLLSRLAVFRGGFTLDAAGQITEANLSALTSLVDNSLLRMSYQPDLPQEARFSLLEPVREYALEKLAARGETDALQSTHAHYYLDLAEAADAAWYTMTANASLTQIGQENDNLRAALQWARDAGNLVIGLRLAEALFRFWRNRGYISEGRVWFAELLALNMEPTETSLALRTRALHGAAWLAADQHDFAQAQRLFEQQAALNLPLAPTQGDVNLMTNAAIQARAEGEYARATALFEEAVGRHRAQGDRGSLATGGLGFSLYFLALVLREQGHFARAVELLQECADLHGELGERAGVAESLLGLSDVARDQGDVALNRYYCEQSLVIYRQFNTQWAIGFALNNLAQAAASEGDLTQALNLVNESLEIFRAQQAEASIAEVLVTQGHILRARGATEGAYAAFSEALRIAQAIGPRLLSAASLEGLSFIMMETGQFAFAVRLFASVSALREHMGVPLRPADRPAVEQALVSAQQILSEETFTALWSEGLPPAA